MKKNKNLPKWIWSEDNARDWTRRWSLFRKSFTLAAAVKEANVIVTATSCHAVYVNGISVGSGDKLGLIKRFDVTPNLRPGRNVVAVRALGGIRQWFYNIEDFRSAVVLELRIKFSSDSVAIATDNTWKVAIDEKDIGWTAQDFDDSIWQNAIAIAPLGEDPGKEAKAWCQNLWALAVEEWNRRPFRNPEKTFTPDHRLVDVLGEEYVQNFNSKIPERIFPSSIYKRKGAVSGAENLLKDDDSVCALGNSSSLILDFQRLVVGYLELEFQGSSEGEIKLQFDRFEKPEEFSKEIEFLTDYLVPERGAKKWRNIQRRAFRYIKLTFNGRRRCGIKRIFLNFSAYSGPYLGFFSCSDKLLNNIWQTGRHTVQMCMHWFYESSPRWERGFFTGDGRVQALVNYYCFGDKELIKYSLRAWVKQRQLKRLIPGSPLIGSWRDAHNGLWDYLAWYIIAVYEYYFYTADSGFVREQYGNMINAIEWLIGRRDQSGLIYQVKIDNVIQEWTCAHDRVGEKLFLNCLFYISLRYMREFSKLLKDGRLAARYLRIGKEVRANINQRLWSEKKSAFIDARTVNFIASFVPEEGNALAVVSGVADKERCRSILDYLKKHHWKKEGSVMYDRSPGKEDYIPMARVPHTGNPIVAPFMVFNEVEAHFKAGHSEDAVELIRRTWGNMLRKGASAFWEYVWHDCGHSHGWSAGVAYSLQANVLGIKPLEPGFGKISIMPQMGGLRWAKGAVPTPQGLVAVSWEDKKEGFKMRALVPEKCRADIALPESKLRERKVYLNKKLVWDRGKRKISAGVKDIFAGKGLMHFIVGSGGYFLLGE